MTSIVARPQCVKGCGLEVIYTMISVLKIHHASLVCGAMARIGIPLGEITAFIWLGLEISWWRHQMETFSTLLAICAGNSPVPGEFPAQRPVTRSSGVFFDLRPNKRLSKQSRGWWFETLSRSLWRHCNDNRQKKMCYTPQRLCAPFHVLLCFVVGWQWSKLPMFFRVTSLALGQPYDCPSASEATPKNMGKPITCTCLHCF